MKHTPGPWARIIADGYTVRHPQIYSDKGPVANTTWLGDGRLDELNANAQLIAAAPELLEALRGLRDAFLGTSVEVQADAMRAARAAINKAVGQS